LREKAKQPAKIKAIRPIGNGDLIAGQEPQGRADAVNRRPVIKPLYYIVSELFLRAVADCDDNVRRTAMVNLGE